MGVVLEVEVPQREFNRRIQPFGIALAEVSWRVKMFTHEGVVLSALYLEEPDLVLAMPFWLDADSARRSFKGSFEICLCSAADPPGRVRLAVQLDPVMVEELFVAAELINPRPSKGECEACREIFYRAPCVELPGLSRRLGSVVSMAGGARVPGGEDSHPCGLRTGFAFGEKRWYVTGLVRLPGDRSL